MDGIREMVKEKRDTAGVGNGWGETERVSEQWAQGNGKEREDGRDVRVASVGIRKMQTCKMRTKPRLSPSHKMKAH